MAAARNYLDSFLSVERKDYEDDEQWIVAVTGLVLHHDNVMALGWMEHTNDWDLRISVVTTDGRHYELLDDVELVFRGATIGNGERLRTWIAHGPLHADPKDNLLAGCPQWELRVNDEQSSEDPELNKVYFFNFNRIAELAWTEA